ncbi:phage regulatory protein [Enterococcus faecalis]|uniref:phage regulatory protein n=2 Tax=Enterococcus faecalis TaxID=1351 RepID=UPI00035271A9|nr:phage regulatory protein [Enterococcus faecalis]EPH89662.1 phage regulatory protein, Rha family [Enterococcus faecalis F01966]MCU2241461.1 phage regulatory protein [Enterococcus faecalis]
MKGEIQMNQLKQTLTSNEVAEMIGKKHSELMKDIRRYIGYLNEGKIPPVDFFIESTYQDSKNEIRPNYLLTKQGCEMVSNKLTGAKGVQFTARYVSRFNQMEDKLKNSQLPMSNTELLLETALKHERELVEVNGRLDKLETETVINSSQRRKIQGLVQSTVIKTLGGKKANAYKNSSINKSAFSNCYSQLKRVFDVASYMDIPKVRYEEAMSLIPKWQPSLELQSKIDTVNGQRNLFEDMEGYQ